MKVVLFCGGLGLRARDGANNVPKPLQVIGGRPLLWHVMRWYAHWGHTEFVLCLGYRAETVVDWFLELAGPVMPEQTSDGFPKVRVLGGEMAGWRVTFADTGLEASVGMRLRAVRSLVEDEPMFLANYSDVFCDVPLPEMLREARASRAVATFLAVPPNHSFHVVQMAEGGLVDDVVPAIKSDLWINGGYFALRPEIFDVLGEGEELVEKPFARLVQQRQLRAHCYRGFWAPMDTAKDRQGLEAMWNAGTRPWALWEKDAAQQALGG